MAKLIATIRAACLLAIALALGTAPALAQANPAPTGSAAKLSIESDVGSLSGAAQRGDAVAQYALGMKLWLGHGVPQNSNAAVGWLMRAAAQDYALAESALGVIYEDGDGVAKDLAKAAAFYAHAATAGEALGEYRLGLLYLQGRGVAKDYALAARWFRAAAEQGMADAENNLGYLYAAGLGVKKDTDAAAGWYAKAARAGNAEAKANLAGLKGETAQAAPAAKTPAPDADLAAIVAALESQPLDNDATTAGFGKPGAVEINSDPSEDGRLEEVRVAFSQSNGQSWLSYGVYLDLDLAREAFDKYGRTPLPAGSSLVRHAFTVGLLSNDRPFTVRCSDSRAAKAPTDEHEVGCAYFEGDAPLVYIGTAVARYKDAAYPPDEVWKRAAGIAAAGYWHAHRVLRLGPGAKRG